MIDEISKSFNNVTITKWANGKVGAIVPARNLLAFRFVGYNYIDGHLYDIHTSDDAKDNCPIIAEGIVAYWLSNKNNSINLFEDYYNYSFKRYCEECAKNVKMLGADLSCSFLKYDHLNRERQSIHVSNKFYEYLPEEDIDTIEELVRSYKSYILNRVIDFNIRKSGTRTPIFERFCMFYRQFKTACNAAEWVEWKYDLGYAPNKKELPPKIRKKSW